MKTKLKKIKDETWTHNLVYYVDSNKIRQKQHLFIGDNFTRLINYKNARLNGLVVKIDH